ncbi:hypothetical protein F5X99DRAFT_310925 [Biscogniauxia marginata]|nr:hypothetical protein F5X99DRAFT_310925 [Biscogniauxia marginata]
MAVPGAIQALIAAFSFGILFTAASATSVLYSKGNGSAIFRDGLRLVLILFLISSTSWSLVEFLSVLIEPTATSVCQAAVIFSSLSDQLGRVFVEQYLVWALHKDNEKTVFSVLPQILVLGRLILGIAFVALTRTHFNPTCVPISQVPAVPITVIALDAVILILLAIRSFSTGQGKGSQNDRHVIDRSKAVNLIIIGLAIWMGTSVTLLLGIATIDLFFRTTLPVIGLTILVALVAVFSGTLVVTRGPPQRPDSPTAQGLERDRDLSSSDSTAYPPSRYEDLKEMNTMTLSAFAATSDMRGYPAISGVDGLPVQGQLFPPMRMNQAELANLPTVSQSRGPRDKRIPVDDKGRKNKGGFKGAGGKIAISKPILKDDKSTPNPLDRIPTIDLATAANNEKARRAKEVKRASSLIAQRPAPLPPSLPERETTINRAASVKRKDVAPKSLADLQRSVSTKTTKTTGGLSIEANASSTATQLSPGTESVRRRSPRQPRSMPVPVTSTSTSNFQAIRPGEPVRIPIPRPTEPSPASPVLEPEKTPLQRRPTNGLPSNPRAQATKAMAEEASIEKKQTVMFVNNIVYDDPNAVNNILHGASKTPVTALDSGDSMVHRPRPIPRKGDKDRQVFPAEISPNHGHRRSKSGNSIASRKSGILQSMPGSPTQLPPLPPPPKSAGTVARPFINNTKSMTFDEKMSILVAPRSAPSMTNTITKRRSSVPEMPPVPDAFLQDAPVQAGQPLDWELDGNGRTSKITDRSTLLTASVLDDTELYRTITPGNRNTAKELNQTFSNSFNRRSSPVIPFGGETGVSPTITETVARDEDLASNWGSVYSLVAPIRVQVSRQNARSTYIEKDSRDSGGNVDQNDESANEVVTVMLDTFPNQSVNNRRSFYQEEGNQPAVNASITEASNPFRFHHRVGDKCPTFSSRQDKGRSRKMPPPAPLLLNGNSTKKRAIVVQAAEPSPLESPEAAYQVIQAQLRKFEQPNRESTESQGRRLALLENLELEMGQLESKWQSTQNQLDRDSLSSIRTSPSRQSRPNSVIPPPRQPSQNSTPAGQQSPPQARLQTGNTIRPNRRSSASMSSSQDSSLSSESTHASLWQTRLAEAQMEYMEHVPDLIMKRNNMNFLSVSKAALGSPSPPDTDDSESDSDIRRSTRAISSIMLKSFIQPHGLWTQQPPVQDGPNAWLWAASTKQSAKAGPIDDLPGLSIRPVSRKSPDVLNIESSQLWQKPTQSSRDGNITNGLWRKDDPMQRTQVATRPVTIRPPRRSKRMTLLPDILESPKPLPDKRGTLGIFQFPWGEKSEHPTIQSRPNQMFMAMPGTMTTGGPTLSATLEARARQIQASEYSSSFFDEYDEEDGDNFDYSDSDIEGDDFDETTLWEIASLLKSEAPSRDSLVLSPQDLAALNASALAEYAVDISSDDEHDDGLQEELEMVPDEPVPQLWTSKSYRNVDHHSFLPMPENTTWERYVSEDSSIVRAQPRAQEPASIKSNTLWTPVKRRNGVSSHELLWVAPKSDDTVLTSFELGTVETTPVVSLIWEQPPSMDSRPVCGLPQPDDTAWQSYIPETDGIVRSQPRAQEKLPSIESSSLWVLSPKGVGASTSALLWTARTSVTNTLAPHPSEKSPADTSFLWVQTTINKAPEVDGLFTISYPRSEHRRTSKQPAALFLPSRTPRVVKEPLAQLTTNQLWTQKAPATPGLNASENILTPAAAIVIGVISKLQEEIASAQPSRLWVQSPSGPEFEHKGLFNASVARDDFRRTSKLPAAITMMRKPLRRSEEAWPQFRSSESLWVKESLISAPAVSIPTQLFVSNKQSSTEVVPNQVQPKTQTHSAGLWIKPANILHSVSGGLFSIGASRQDLKRTSEAPAAIFMTRKPRTTRKPLGPLITRSLWAVSPAVNQTPIASKNLLWTKTGATAAAGAKLFQPDEKRVDWRTTSAEPAALTMSRRSSIKRGSVQKLESTRLWVSTQVASAKIDWISISSVRPGSPSATSISTLSSSPSSPITDAASVKTSITKVSSVPESTKSNGGFFRGWWGKKDKKVPDVPKVPENVEPKIRHGAPITPELPVEFVVKNLDETAQKDPARIPLRRQHRPTLVYRQDWDGALREAMVASYPGTMLALRATYPRNWDEALLEATRASHIAPKIIRKKTTPKEWSMALRHAIAASYPNLRASRGPVPSSQWKAELDEAILKGRSLQPANFDVSIRHPVFFSSTTPPSDIHPAMHGYAVDNMERNQILISTKTTSPMAPTTATKSLLWVKPTQADIQASTNTWTVSNDLMPEIKTISLFIHPRKGKAIVRDTKIEIGAEFGKQGLWKQTQDSWPHEEKNWLDDMMKKRFTRVELRY